MLINGIDMDTFLLNLRKIVMSAVIKQTKYAKLTETKDTKLAGDKYVSAIETGDNWGSYVGFDRPILVKAGIPSILINRCLEDKELIPPEYRERVITLQKNFNITSFKERNNYYRMLNGKPDIGDRDFIYVPENDYGLPTNVPVHELDPQQAHLLTATDIVEELIKKHPTKKYLKFLGSYGIPYYNSRVARNYDLLYILPTDQDYISNGFVKAYNEARDYVMLGLYTQNDNKLYEFYDEFMGFLIMIIAIQRFLGDIFKQGITRDFFDDTLIRYLYEGYNMPYFEDIAVKYQRVIAKDLNLLLQAKSSNQGLYDVTNIFNFVKVNIYKYYLVKDYKKDSKDQPIIKYKTVVDEEGNAKEVIDYENTYDIWFQKVNIKNMDPAAAIADPSNKEDYWSVTGGDPYWINDSDLLEKIYSNDYNSLITKYMGIDIIYSMTRTFYESTYTIRMMIDDQEEFDKLKLNISKLSADYISLYELVIFLCALVALKFGLRGEIPLKPYQISNVYGFNFKADLAKIREELLARKTPCSKRIDPEVMKFFIKVHAPTLNDVDDLYDNITALRKFIDEQLRLTRDLETYECYKKLYDSLLITEDVKDLYKKPNGDYADTYYDLLKGKRPDLAELLDGMRGNTNIINETIDYLLGKLGKLHDDFKFIPSLNEKGDLIRMIEKLINEFKSYTVSDAYAGIVYVLDDPHLNMLKILDKLKSMEVNITIDDRTAMKYIYDDCISHIKVTRRYDEKLKLDTDYLMVTFRTIKALIHFYHKIHLIEKEVQLDDFRGLTLWDIYNNITKELELDPNNKHRLELEHYLYMLSTVILREKFPMSEPILWECVVNMILNRDLEIFQDVAIYKKMEYAITVKYMERCLERAVLTFKDNWHWKHTLQVSEPIYELIQDTLHLIDYITETKDEDITDSIELKEYFNRIIDISQEEKIHLLHIILSMDVTDVRFDSNLWVFNVIAASVLMGNYHTDNFTHKDQIIDWLVNFDRFREFISVTSKISYRKYNALSYELLIDMAIAFNKHFFDSDIMTINEDSVLISNIFHTDTGFLTDLVYRNRFNPKNNTIETVVENSIFSSTDKKAHHSTTTNDYQSTNGIISSKNELALKHTLKKWYS